MAYNAASIANFFLDQADEEGAYIDPMKLQKLLYYANGWWAGEYREPLIAEPVEAWKYGPVFPSIYREFQGFKGNPITSRARKRNTLFSKTREEPVLEDEDTKRFLKRIWTKYGRMRSMTLSDMTHAPGGPWDIVREDNPDKSSVVIPLDVIADHFAEALNSARAA